MRNFLVIVLFGSLLTFAIVREPSTDIIDTMAGASTDTFNTTLDGFSGALKNDSETKICIIFLA